MTNRSNHDEVALHALWGRKPATYQKPSSTGKRESNLLQSPSTSVSLGYILFINGKRITMQGSAALEFVEDDPEPLRRDSLHMKVKPGFHVYYKDQQFWYGVPQHFDDLASAIPYLQSGNRVLVEYRTK